LHQASDFRLALLPLFLGVGRHRFRRQRRRFGREQAAFSIRIVGIQFQRVAVAFLGFGKILLLQSLFRLAHSPSEIEKFLILFELTAFLVEFAALFGQLLLVGLSFVLVFAWRLRFLDESRRRLWCRRPRLSQ